KGKEINPPLISIETENKKSPEEEKSKPIELSVLENMRDESHKNMALSLEKESNEINSIEAKTNTQHELTQINNQNSSFYPEKIFETRLKKELNREDFPNNYPFLFEIKQTLLSNFYQFSPLISLAHFLFVVGRYKDALYFFNYAENFGARNYFNHMDFIDYHRALILFKLKEYS